MLLDAGYHGLYCIFLSIHKLFTGAITTPEGGLWGYRYAGAKSEALDNIYSLLKQNI